MGSAHGLAAAGPPARLVAPLPFPAWAGDRAALHRFAGDVAAGLLLALLWAGTYVLAPALALGWQPVLVTGASMAPHLAPGDVLLLADPAAGIRRGSVITFRPQGQPELVTHRVVEVLPEGYRTRGDANGVVDSDVVPPSRVVGVGRLLVPALGRPTVWLQRGELAPALLVAGVVLVSAALVLTAPPPPPPAPRTPGRLPDLVRSGLLQARSSPALRPVLAAAAAAALVAVPASAAAAAVVLSAAAGTAPAAVGATDAGPAGGCRASRPARRVAGPPVRVVVPLGPAVPRPERVLGLGARGLVLRTGLVGPVAAAPTFLVVAQPSAVSCRSARVQLVRLGPPLPVADRPVLGPPARTPDRPVLGPPARTPDRPVLGPPARTPDRPVLGPPLPSTRLLVLRPSPPPLVQQTAVAHGRLGLRG